MGTLPLISENQTPWASAQSFSSMETSCSFVYLVVADKNLKTFSKVFLIDVFIEILAK
jgi:hypothetical protein